MRRALNGRRMGQVYSQLITAFYHYIWAAYGNRLQYISIVRSELDLTELDRMNYLKF